MAGQISDPHDKLFKQLLGEPENAADFVANNLPADLVSHLDLKTLQVVQASFIDTQFIQSEADLLFSVTVAERPGFVYFLFEHQSSPDGFMMLRLLGYMVRVWKRFQRENPEWDQLPVIIPMVLFHGPRGWNAPVSFRSLVDLPAESFVPYTPAFQCKLYDLSPFGQDHLAGNAVIRILADLLGAYGRSDFEKGVRRAFDTLNELINAPGFGKVLEIVFRYVLHVFDIPQEELGRLVAQTVKRDVREFIMTTYERLRQEGEQIGLRKGSNLVLVRLLAKKFGADPEQLMPLVDGFSEDRQEELVGKILESRSLQEVVDWLKTAGQN